MDSPVKVDVPLSRIVSLVEAMREMPKVDCPLRHEHLPGLYLRQVFVPKGTAVVTKVHRVKHPFIVSAGSALVWSPGDVAKLIRAPYTGVTEPGTIRLAIALEDLIWTTVHATDKTDPKEIEREVTYEPSEALKLEMEQWRLLQ